MSGFSGTPLTRKLGYRPEDVAYVGGGPEDYGALLAPLPPGVRFTDSLSDEVDIAHVFVTDRAELAASLREFRQVLAPAATVWVSWPKRASRVRTDVTEDTVRELALPLGFVDVKVCAVTDVWSGLKLVVRKELR